MKLGWEDNLGHENPENSQTPRHEDTMRRANTIYEKSALIRNGTWWHLSRPLPSLQSHEEEISGLYKAQCLLCFVIAAQTLKQYLSPHMTS